MQRAKTDDKKEERRILLLAEKSCFDGGKNVEQQNELCRDSWRGAYRVAIAKIRGPVSTVTWPTKLKHFVEGLL